MTCNKNLKRIMPVEKVELFDKMEMDDSGIEPSCPDTPNTPTSPFQVITNSFTRPAEQLCWAPKRPRVIKRLDRENVKPRQLFLEQDDDMNEENEENTGRITPPLNEMDDEQIQRLLMAPGRPRMERETNPNVRRVRLFHTNDQGYNTDEDPQSERSDTNFSVSPGKFLHNLPF